MQNITDINRFKITNYSFWVWTAIIFIVGLVVILSVTDQSIAAIYWLVGVVFGVTVQRSRFCFTSAFRDFFLLGQTRMIKGILVGLAVSSVGFVMVMSTVAPNPGFGAFPSDAHVLPVGLSTLIAGTLFGIGMVLAGGCVSGSLYRMGEGYVASWVAILGVMVGLFLLNNTWNWWWDNLISQEIAVWIPAEISYSGALFITAVGLLVVLYIALARERRVTAGFVMPEIKKLAVEGTPTSTAGEIFDNVKSIFRKEWSPIVGGIILAVVNIILFIRFHPLGVVGEISRWSTSFINLFGVPPVFNEHIAPNSTISQVGSISMVGL